MSLGGFVEKRNLVAFLASGLLGLGGSSAGADVVISQIYGGGGNSGAPFSNDFVEIFNAGSVTQDLSGWSLQYASATGFTFSTVALSGLLGPGQYFLVQAGSGGGGGAPLPAPDAATTINLSATAGKVALVSNATPLSGSCPSGSAILDFVGYGATATCFEGSGPAPSLSNSTSIFRAANGCTDTDQNTSDFSTGFPGPRNAATPAHSCIPVTVCGDGVIDDGEACDEGPDNGTTTSCCTLMCSFLPPGTECDDENACTRTDACDAAGVCEGSDAIVCTASDACHEPGTCDPADGSCSNPAREDGVACDDGDSCTLGDTCQSGTCEPGAPTLGMPAADLPQTLECVSQTIDGLLP